MRNHNTQLVYRAIEENTNMQVLRAKMAKGRTQICKMRNEQGEIVTGKTDIVAAIQKFYCKLYSVSIQQHRR